MPRSAASTFCLLVPVKRVARAKSRLAPLGDAARRALVAAFALDTVSAALAAGRVGEVLVVTDDEDLAPRLAGLGAHVLPDGVAGDLNGSLLQAAAEAGRRWPGLAPAALCADLPALRPEELGRALRSAAAHPSSFVPDIAGVGTTMVLASSVELFRPRFGLGSREAHLVGGAHELVEIDVPTLRRDVDTPADLRDALRLGVGAHTARVADGLRLWPVQATVSSFNPATLSGAVLLDDGVELPFDAGAFAGSGLRLLRPGQRVRLETAGEGAQLRVLGVQLITLA